MVVALTNALTTLENKVSDKANDVQAAKRALEDATKRIQSSISYLHS